MNIPNDLTKFRILRAKVHAKSTSEVTELSTEVLNEGIKNMSNEFF